jgi:hypothetical protein
MCVWMWVLFIVVQGNRSSLPIEIVPQLKYIMQPNIKVQSLHNMSLVDKARLEAHANIMADMGLNYSASHDAAESKALVRYMDIDK